MLFQNGSSPLQVVDTMSQAGSPDSGSDMDELNTKDLAQRISAELKRYSIPQAIFAQRVLCRFPHISKKFFFYSFILFIYYICIFVYLFVFFSFLKKKIFFFTFDYQ